MKRSSTVAPVLDRSNFDVVRAEIADVFAAVGDSPLRSAKAQAFLSGVGQELAPPFVEMLGVSTAGTNEIVFRIQVTERFREFARAIRAGEAQDQVVDALVHGCSNG